MLTVANGTSSSGTSYAKVSCKQSKTRTQKRWMNERMLQRQKKNSLPLHMMKVLAGKTEQCPCLKKKKTRPSTSSLLQDKNKYVLRINSTELVEAIMASSAVKTYCTSAVHTTFKTNIYTLIILSIWIG